MNVQCFRILSDAFPHNNRSTLLPENISLFSDQQLFLQLVTLLLPFYLNYYFSFYHPIPYIPL
jgi:hypothetical protein